MFPLGRTTLGPSACECQVSSKLAHRWSTVHLVCTQFISVCYATEVVQPRGGVLEVPVPEVRTLAHRLTDKLTAVTGWSELGEYNLALASLSLCGELLTQIYRVLQDVVPPPS
jgi:hypothetical protein